MGCIRYYIRRKIRWAGAFVAISALTPVQLCHASPWSRDNGELLVISRADYFRSDLESVSIGGVDVGGTFERLESNTYLEYGVTDKLTVGGKVLYGTSWLTRGASIQSDSGFTELEAFAQHQVFRNDRHAGALKVAVGIPSGLSAGVRSGQQSDGADLEVALLYGRSLTFNPIKTFAAVEFDFQKRFSNAADQMHFLTTVGIEPNDRWIFLIDMFAVKSLRNAAPGGADFDVLKIQPTLAWRATKRFSFQLGVTKEIAGRNLDLGSTYFVGLRTRF